MGVHLDDMYLWLAAGTSFTFLENPRIEETYELVVNNYKSWFKTRQKLKDVGRQALGGYIVGPR